MLLPAHQGSQTLSISVQSVAAYGSLKIRDARGFQFSTPSPYHRSAQLPSRRQIRTYFMSEPASPTCARRSRSATDCINRSTQVRHGLTLVSICLLYTSWGRVLAIILAGVNAVSVIWFYVTVLFFGAWTLVPHQLWPNVKVLLTLGLGVYVVWYLSQPIIRRAFRHLNTLPPTVTG